MYNSHLEIQCKLRNYTDTLIMLFIMLVLSFHPACQILKLLPYFLTVRYVFLKLLGAYRLAHKGIATVNIFQKNLTSFADGQYTNCT